MGMARTVAGKYQILEELGVGGMASVHLARMVGPAGFSRIVAVKRMHDHLAKDPKFVRMFLEEGRLAGRIRHPNVVATLDVLVEGAAVWLVLDYVEGESLAKLLRTSTADGGKPQTAVTCAILTGILSGLDAAHEATGASSRSLEIIHRDVSPENVLVGIDGVPRVLDFGIAKAASRLESTASGGLRGKLGYMAPEQLRGEAIDRRVDVYAAGVVLWEALAGRRLFDRRGASDVVNAVLGSEIAPPSRFAPDVSPALDAIALRALAATPAERFGTAGEMARAIESAAPIVSAREVGAWVESVAGATIRARARRVAELDVAEAVPPMPIGLPERRAPADQLTDALGAEAQVEEPPPVSRPAPRMRRSRVLVLVLLLLAGVCLAALSFGLARRRAPMEQPPALAMSAAPLPLPTFTTAPLAPSLASASASEPPAPRRSSPPPRRRPTNTSERCTPPFVIEPDGTKRFKTECL
jgi:hypothetical protein